MNKLKNQKTAGSSSETNSNEGVNKDDQRREKKEKKKKEKSNKPKEMKLDLRDIIVDKKYQARVELNNSIVNEYAANMKDNAPFHSTHRV